jgi:hypothetical protein
VLDHITEDELALYAGRPHHDIDCRDAVDYFTFNNKMRLGLCVIHETTARRWMISEKNDWAFSARPLKTMEG